MNKIRVFTLFSAVMFFLTGESHAAQIQGVTINAGPSLASSSLAGYTTLATNLTAISDRRETTNLVVSTGLFGDMHTYALGDFWLSGGAGQAATNFVVFNLRACLKNQIEPMFMRVGGA